MKFFVAIFNGIKYITSALVEFLISIFGIVSFIISLGLIIGIYFFAKDPFVDFIVDHGYPYSGLGYAKVFLILLIFVVIMMIEGKIVQLAESAQIELRVARERGYSIFDKDRRSKMDSYDDLKNKYEDLKNKTEREKKYRDYKYGDYHYSQNQSENYKQDDSYDNGSYNSRNANASYYFDKELQEALGLFMFSDVSDITEEKLKKQRNKLMKAFHPDTGEDDQEYAKKINTAYSLLKKYL